MTLDDIVIDEEFASFLPSLTPEESEQLRVNMMRADSNGQELPSLKVWKGHRALLDGHHRLDIARLCEIDFPIEELEFPDRAACIAWIAKNQLGRRNLDPKQASYYRGMEYNAAKASHGGDRKSNGKSCHLKSAETMAAEHNVSEKTIRNDGKFAAAVDKAAAEKGPQERKRILESNTPRKEIVEKAMPQTTEKPQPVAKLQGVGVMRAQEAVDCLKRIPKNDPLRESGFKIVRDWMRVHK